MKPGGRAGGERQETAVPTGTVAVGVSEPLRTQAPTGNQRDTAVGHLLCPAWCAQPSSYASQCPSAGHQGNVRLAAGKQHMSNGREILQFIISSK